MRISDWSSDVCSSDLVHHPDRPRERDDDEDDREDQREHRPPAFRAGVHVEEVDHVDDDLDEGEGEDDERRRRPIGDRARHHDRSEEHTSELQSLMRITYPVFCLKKKKYSNIKITST